MQIFRISEFRQVYMRSRLQERLDFKKEQELYKNKLESLDNPPTLDYLLESQDTNDLYYDGVFEYIHDGVPDDEEHDKLSDKVFDIVVTYNGKNKDMVIERLKNETNIEDFETPSEVLFGAVPDDSDDDDEDSIFELDMFMDGIGDIYESLFMYEYFPEYYS